jgi:lipopolysaccharide biosynthesis protein
MLQNHPSENMQRSCFSAIDSSSGEETDVRLITFFLTQFHPTKENDLWWGKGFTEWTNVTKATPLFPGHYQPHLPSDLGFYDLRLRETRIEQIELAKQYGIDGFCYHYYWFSGERILNQPLDAMLADPDHSMPFCLCWANENWTRRWDAAEQDILIAQRYLPDDDLNFIKSLVPFFQDPRYIRMDGAPVFIVYRPQHLPDARRTLSVWREYCRSIGIERLYIVAALTHGNEDYERYGFDGGVEFPPHNLRSGNVNSSLDFYEPFYGNVMEYHTVAQSYIDRSYTQKNVFRSVFPAWDNTARTSSRALVIENGTPDNYEYWLSETIRRSKMDFPGEERLVFINAWNEWAEGCHLEPDRRYGRGFLEATLRAKNGMSDLQSFTDVSLPPVAVIVRRTFLGDIRWVLRCHFAAFLGRLRLRIQRFPVARKIALLLVSGARYLWKRLVG